MPRLPTTAVLSLAALAIALPACVIRLGGPDSGIDFPSWGSHNSNTTVNGQDVSEYGGMLIVDGHELRHDRWVDVPLATGCCELLDLHTATGQVSLVGQAGDGVLHVRLWSQTEGDGSVTLQDGRLVAEGHGTVFVNEVTGSVPHGLSVRAGSGTGAVSLCGLQQAGRLEVESGIGEVEIRDCLATSIGVESGTADVRLRGGEAERVDLSSGTGELTLVGAHFGQVQADTGTGDVTVRDCVVQRLQANSGTGNVIMHGGRVEEFHHDLGTGEVYIHGGGTVGLAD